VAGGIELLLHVQPGARRTGLIGEHAGRLKVAVGAPALDGRANDALVALLAETAGVARRAVQVTHGTAARDKRVRIAGVPDHLLSRLQAALA
jgi:uncharacterized protein (TIGR00251 family)